MSDLPVKLTPAPEGYADWLADLKGRIHAARQRATLAVNHELVRLYWHIGRDILDRQAAQGWGAKVIERLSQDLREAFPGNEGGFVEESQVYAGFCRGMARDGICPTACGPNCAAACCTNGVG